MSESERVHFKIALPAGLKRALEHQAVENRRSLSAEIISRLEASIFDVSKMGLLNSDPAPTVEQIAKDLEQIKKMIEKMNKPTKKRA